MTNKKSERLTGKAGIPEEKSLAEIVPKTWFNNGKGHAWMQIFSSLLIPAESFFPMLEGALKTLDFDEPVSIAYLRLGGLKLNIPQGSMFAAENGELQLSVFPFKKELPLSNYVVLSTPRRDPGNVADYLAAKSRLAEAAALIIIHVGRNFMWDIVYDGQVDLNENAIGGVAQTNRLPAKCEGPFLHIDHWDDIEEIGNRINTLSPTKKDRLRLGLKYLNRASRKEDGFFEYWTALEVICDGRSGAIKEKVKKCYGFKSVKESDEIGMHQIARWRHDYFHKGKEIQISRDVERYIQLLLLDLLRYEAGLELKAHAFNFASLGDCDLTSIGIARN